MQISKITALEGRSPSVISLGAATHPIRIYGRPELDIESTLGCVGSVEPMPSRKLAEETRKLSQCLLLACS